MDQVSSSPANLQALINQLCSEGSETTTEWTSCLDLTVSLANGLIHRFDLDCRQLDQLSIQLWNKTVILKTKGNLDCSSLNKLRQIAFQMVSSINDSNINEVSLKKQIMMGLKITRSWLDMKELSNAEKILKILDQAVQQLQCLIVEKANNERHSTIISESKKEVESDMIHIFCMNAELKFAQGEKDEAYSMFTKAQNMLSNVPEQTQHLSVLCYNFGVDCFHGSFYDQAIKWLKCSYNIAKDGPHMSHKVQARTLRLLVNCYIESKEDGWEENALNAIALANKESAHPAGLYLCVQLNLAAQEKDETVRNSLRALINHDECTLDLCLNTLQLMKTFQRLLPAFDLRHEMVQKFQMSPKLGLFLVTLLDLLLNNASKSLNMAKTFAEECVTAHVSGQRLDAATRKQFHILVWNKASHFFKKEEFEEAVTWYTYSLSLYHTATQCESNLAKLHRNMASCYLSMGCLEKAYESIDKASHCDPSCPQTHFIAFKLALETNNIEQASASLQKLVNNVSADGSIQEANIICMSAFLGIEKGKTDLVIPALEYIINRTGDGERILVSLKCLLRLKVSQMEDKRIDVNQLRGDLQTAYNRLLVMQDEGSLEKKQLQDEASWFMKISWNLALKSEHEPVLMKDLYVICSQLLSLCATDLSSHNKSQTCLVMACAVCLQLARQPQEKEAQRILLEEVVEHVEEYKQAHNQAQNSLWAQGPLQSSSPSDSLILMFEFEALAKLNHPKAEAVLQRAFTLPKPDPSLFHTLAALACDPPSQNSSLSMRALKVAIRMHLQKDNPDFKVFSLYVRSLIELCMKNSEAEALSYFKETLDMISKQAKEQYPEIELLWLMTKSWNRGLQYFNCNKFSMAEQWCSLSMRLLKHLPSSRKDYEEQMMSLYGELMNCLERERKPNAAEE